MCQFGSHTVLLAGAGSSQLLGNDKLGDVDTIAEEVRDNLLCIGEGILRGPVECNIGKIVLNQTGALHKSCSHLSMRSLCKQVLMRLATRGQLSRRTCTNTDHKGRPLVQNQSLPTLFSFFLFFHPGTSDVFKMFVEKEFSQFQFLCSPSCHRSPAV